MKRSPIEICRQRTVCAVLATGVVISLTALTGGIAPAFAEPGSDPTTTVAVPVPVVTPEQTASRPTAAEVPAVTAPPVVVAPTVEAPVVVAPPVEVPTRTQAPVSTPAVEAPAQTRETEAPAPTPVVTPTRSTPTATATETTAAPTSSQESTPSPSATATSTSKSPTAETPSTSTATSSSSSSSSATPQLAPGSSGASETSGTSSSATISPGESSTSSSSSSSTASSSSESTSGSNSGSTDSSGSKASASEAARALPKIAPETLAAPEADVKIAEAAEILAAPPPVEAPKKDLDEISNLIDLPGLDRRPPGGNGGPNGNGGNGGGPNGGRGGNNDVQLAGNWDKNVRQWQPDWVNYDEYHRPLLSNPYRDPVRIVYIYENAPRIVYIPPLARIVLDVAQYAAYSFTAVVANAVNTATNVAVGSFLGGGYYPGPGLPPPPAPPPLPFYNNVPVQVNYQNATYQPFRVNRIVDVGDDAQVGERKVLLDGVTPAWGTWTQSPSGERQFVVHKTQQFPGLDSPGQGPLPGNYQLQLASDESPSGMSNRDIYLLSAAGVLGALSIGAVVLSIFIGRRRGAQH